eukprot:3534869-Ditylum_brightwellii.AAC.1
MHDVLLSVYTNPHSQQGCVESNKIQTTRAGNPERWSAVNDVTKMTCSNLGYLKYVILGGYIGTAANDVIR